MTEQEDVSPMGRKMTWGELAEENARLKKELEELHKTSLQAIWIANQRSIRGQAFMNPEAFARTHYEIRLSAGRRINAPWNELHAEARIYLHKVAEQVYAAYAKAVDGNGTEAEDNPAVTSLLQEANLLGAALRKIHDLEQDGAWKRLEQLDDWLTEAFPRLEVQGNDRVMDSVRRAIAVMEIVKTYAPSLLKLMWNELIQPTIRSLEKMGVFVFPSGTVVYGTEPKKD